MEKSYGGNKGKNKPERPADLLLEKIEFVSSTAVKERRLESDEPNLAREKEGEKSLGALQVSRPHHPKVSPARHHHAIYPKGTHIA